MFDIEFLMSVNQTKKRIVGGDHIPTSKIVNIVEMLRSPIPYVCNIETTNLCNMKCIMCPRTSLMNRKIETMDMGLFADIVDQIKCPSPETVKKFYDFVKKEYGIARADRHEDSFYFYRSCPCLTLHGYGEPVLDPHIVDRVQLCTDKGIPTYFSCVPANIQEHQMRVLMEAGLTVVKFAMDALTDAEQKEIRGDRSNFSEAYNKILRTIELKEKNGFSTEIVLTMIDLGQDLTPDETKSGFMKLWADQPVFSYVKSQDNRWYYEDDDTMESKSHYERQYCEFPWLSLSVMADGSIVPCTQDYNCEIVFGNARRDTLESVWNGTQYAIFRKAHITGAGLSAYKCADRCDLRRVSDYV